VAAARIVTVQGAELMLSSSIAADQPIAAWVRTAEGEMVFAVVSHTGASVTLSAPAAAVHSGDPVEFTRLETLDALLGGLRVKSSDRVFLRQENRWQPYQPTATGWRTNLRSADATSPAFVQPGEGLLLDLPDRSERLWFAGELRPGPVLRWVPLGHTAFLGPLAGSATAIADLTETVLPAWRTSTRLNTPDALRLWGNQHFTVFTFDGERWRSVRAPDSNATLPPGCAALVERRH
jgi:hypothetical protein